MAKRKRPRKPGPSRGSSVASKRQPAPWRLKFSQRIVDDDLREIGSDAYETAKRAIDKKLRVSPRQYGEGLRPPLTGLYKLKASHIRIVYHVEDSDHEVWVLMIADRRTIWDRHEKEMLSRLEGMHQAKRARK